jgi:RimJ/RimL family protein N-acetyltransferase
MNSHSALPNTLRSPVVSELAIRQVQPSDLPGIQNHLLRMSADDRSLRFSAGVVKDDTIVAYVSSVRLDHDVVICLFNDHHKVVGLAHGCVYPVQSRLYVEAAFSIDAAWRGQGWGTRLMQSVQVQARALGAKRVLGLCAVRNLPMRRVFEGAGMQLERLDDEIHAHCEPPALAAVA